MFNFLSHEERKQKKLKNVQAILDAEVKKAKEIELQIGIDPETYLGREILKQSREILVLKHEIAELKRMTAKLLSCHNVKKNKTDKWNS